MRASTEPRNRFRSNDFASFVSFINAENIFSPLKYDLLDLEILPPDANAVTLCELQGEICTWRALVKALIITDIIVVNIQSDKDPSIDKYISAGVWFSSCAIDHQLLTLVLGNCVPRYTNFERSS